MKMQINTFLPVRCALALGCSEHGNITITPTDTEFARLNAAERTALAHYVVTGGRGKSYSTLSVDAPAWDGVVRAVRGKIEDARKNAAEKAANTQREIDSYLALLARPRHYDDQMPPQEVAAEVGRPHAPNYSKNDPTATRLWDEWCAAKRDERARLIAAADAALSYQREGESLAAPIRAVLQAASGDVVAAPNASAFNARLVAELEQERVAAVRALLQAHGTPDQLERCEAGVLPESELTSLIEASLFERLASCTVYDEITEQEVAHDLECELGDVRFSTRDYDDGLNAEQFARLKAIRAAAGDYEVEVRMHVGYHADHDDDADPEITRLSARVTAKFAGDKYRREYAI